MKKDPNFELVAFCPDYGSRENRFIEVKVTQISGWRMNRPCKELTKLALDELLDISLIPQHKILVYNSDYEGIHGHLSSSAETPLYSNGEMEVARLELNGEVVWDINNIDQAKKINKLESLMQNEYDFRRYKTDPNSRTIYWYRAQHEYEELTGQKFVPKHEEEHKNIKIKV